MHISATYSYNACYVTIEAPLIQPFGFDIKRVISVCNFYQLVAAHIPERLQCSY